MCRYAAADIVHVLSALINTNKGKFSPFFFPEKGVHWGKDGLRPGARNYNTLAEYLVIDLLTVFDAILTSKQTCEKLQCLYENLMSNSFRKTTVLKKKNVL